MLTQLRLVGLLGVGTLAIAAATGAVVGLAPRQWLAAGLGASLVIWVGGAVTGQVLLARLLDRDAGGHETAGHLHQLLWIIPRLYVPLGVVALGCGLGLVAVSGTPFATPTVLVPLALYLLTAVAGATVSAPGYLRLLRLARHRGPGHPDVRRRLLALAWLNRAELVLVVGVGFVMLAGVV